MRQMNPSLPPMALTQVSESQDWGRNTRGTWGSSCCWNNRAETPSPGHIRDPPTSAHLSQSRFVQCHLETRHGDRATAEAEGRGDKERVPRGGSCLVQSAAPALPSAQSFPPASLVSITSSRNANQCICKTWK